MSNFFSCFMVTGESCGGGGGGGGGASNQKWLLIQQDWCQLK